MLFLLNSCTSLNQQESIQTRLKNLLSNNDIRLVFYKIKKTVVTKHPFVESNQITLQYDGEIWDQLF
jgi:hypothetical protein